MDQHSQYEFFPMVGVAIPTGAMALQEDSFYLSGMQLLHVRTLFSKSLSMFGHHT
jgi:hypothetical protein